MHTINMSVDGGDSRLAWKKQQGKIFVKQLYRGYPRQLKRSKASHPVVQFRYQQF